MPSNGPNVIACLDENLNLLSDALGIVKPENVPLWNISQALRGMYLDIEAEFQNTQSELQRLNARLTTLEQRLQR